MSKKGKLIYIISALIVAMIVSIGFLVNAVDGKISNVMRERDAPRIIAYDDSGNGLVGGTVYPLSKGMIFRSLDIDTYSVAPAITVSVTPIPFYATEAEIKWELSWVNPIAEWVGQQGPSHFPSSQPAAFLTVTPKPTDKFKADIALIKGFGEQIKLTVSAKNDSSVYDVCIIDCLGEVMYSYIAGNISSVDSPQYNGYVELGNPLQSMYLGDYALANIANLYNPTVKAVGYPNSTILESYSYTIKYNYSSEYYYLFKGYNGYGSAKTVSGYLPLSLSDILTGIYSVYSNSSSIAAAKAIKSAPILTFEISGVGTYTSFNYSFDIYINPAW